MSSEAFTPTTSMQEPALAGMPRIYTTTREVPAQYEAPARGSEVGSILPRYKHHIVLDCQIMPKGGKRIAIISHCEPPDWNTLLGSVDRKNGEGEYLYETQVVPTPTQAEIEADVHSTYDPIDETKSLRRTKIARRLNPDGTYTDGYPNQQVKSIGVENLIPQKFRSSTTTAQTTTTEDLPAANVDDIPDPQFPSPRGDVSKVTHQKLNDTQYARIIEEEEIDENAAPLAGKLTDTWGINTSSEQIVEDGDFPDSGFGVKASRVAPLGNGKSVKETERYPLVNGSSIIYTLTGLEIDETTKATFEIKKSLVSADEALQLANQTTLGYSEVQPLDKWHSILISTKVLNHPESQTWKETGQISLPDELLEAGVIWDSDIVKEVGTAGVNNAGDIISEDLSWSAAVDASITGTVFGRPYHKVRSGFKGAAEITVVRTFHEGPPNSLIQAHLFRPVYGTITVHGVQGSRAGKGAASGRGILQIQYQNSFRRHIDTKMAIKQFGPFEHNNIALTEKGDPKTVQENANGTAGGTPGPEPFPAVSISLALSGSASLELPVSSIPLQTGQSFITSVQVSPWKFGWWVREVYTAKVP